MPACQMIDAIRKKLADGDYEMTLPHFIEEMAGDDIRLNPMKTKPTRYAYGACEICDTPLEEKQVKQDFWIGGRLIVVENVPAGVCPQCGEKVVNATVGRHLAELVRDTKRIAKAARMSVPALAYQ